MTNAARLDDAKKLYASLHENLTRLEKVFNNNPVVLNELTFEQLKGLGRRYADYKYYHIVDHVIKLAKKFSRQDIATLWVDNNLSSVFGASKLLSCKKAHSQSLSQVTEDEWKELRIAESKIKRWKALGALKIESTFNHAKEDLDGSYVFFDTETTGLSHVDGDRIIEIGCVKVRDGLVVDRFHTYINPLMQSSPEALRVHRLSYDFLKDKPLFIEVVENFLKFISGAQLVAHNAKFDIGFINAELQKCQLNPLDPQIIKCSRIIAKKILPGKRHSLDSLCAYYKVNTDSRKDRHGALIDAELLSQVYYRMILAQAQTTLLRADSRDNNDVFAIRNEDDLFRLLDAFYSLDATQYPAFFSRLVFADHQKFVRLMEDCGQLQYISKYI